MSRAFPSEQKKWETNSGPLLEVTWEGTPCLEKTWVTKSFANSGEVMVSWVGMKMPCLERWSMITRMEEEGKVFNEIHGDGVPRSLWHRELSEESIGAMTWSLSMSTSSTGAHILLDKGAELWPSVFVSD